MDNYNNEVFEFGVEPNEELEQTNDFDYASISGLGESDYQNEDLFNTEVEDNETFSDNDYRIGSLDSVGNVFNDNLNVNQFEVEEPVSLEEQTITSEDIFEMPIEPVNQVLEQEDNEEIQNLMGDAFSIPIESVNESQEEDNEKAEQMMGDTFSIPIEPANEVINQEEDINSEVYEFNPEPIINEEESYSNENVFELAEETVNGVQEETIEDSDDNQEIVVSETPIEELNELIHYEEEKIEETDINNLFDRVSVNVKEASDIFRKNTDLKKKIDTRFGTGCGGHQRQGDDFGS